MTTSMQRTGPKYGKRGMTSRKPGAPAPSFASDNAPVADKPAPRTVTAPSVPAPSERKTPMTPVPRGEPFSGESGKSGGIDVNSYSGSRYAPGGGAPNPGYQPKPSGEAAADRMLRSQFGAPPNERGQIDTASGGRKWNNGATSSPVGSTGMTQTPPAATGGQGAPHVNITIHHGGSQDMGDSPDAGDRSGFTGQPGGGVAPTAAAPTPAATPMQPAAPVSPAANPLPMSSEGKNRAMLDYGSTAKGSPLPKTSPFTAAPPSPATPAQSMGFSSRGSSVPKGNDAIPKPGLYDKKFLDPKRVRPLFSNLGEI